MNITDLRSAQVRFENKIDNIKKDRNELYKLRKKFTSHFSTSFISKMKIEDYASGLKHINSSDRYNFCYSLEWDLDRLGTIRGSQSIKFGLYYSPSTQKYEFAVKKFGETESVAFQNIKRAILELIAAGKDMNMNLIEANPLSPTFKGKILSTYFPDEYLGIFSNDHLDYFLAFFDLDNDAILNEDAIHKREALVKYKNNDKYMHHWSLDMFTRFLYDEYPGRPPKGNDATNDKDDNNILFAKNQNSQFVDLVQDDINNTPSTKRKDKLKKPNYESEAQRKRKLGDRGEKLVMDIERKRLCDTGLEHLAKKIKWVSRESDSYGYDILSYNEDGSKRYIEVKATSGSIGTTNFFISSNEYDVAKEMGANYYVYIVYDILTSEPKVWMSNNIFSEENNDKLLLTPTNYRVTINTKRSK